MRSFLPRVFISSWAYHSVRWALALLFLYAGVSKLADLQGFGVIIADFGLLPATWVAPFALIFPALEVVAAVGLLCDMRGFLSFIVFQLLLFMAVLSYGIWLGLEIDCGCFGPDDPEAEVNGHLSSALWRDAGMVVGACYLYWWRYSQLTRQSRSRLLIRNNPKRRNGNGED